MKATEICTRIGCALLVFPFGWASYRLFARLPDLWDSFDNTFQLAYGSFVTGGLGFLAFVAAYIALRRVFGRRTKFKEVFLDSESPGA